jgi:hypothetical protein
MAATALEIYKAQAQVLVPVVRELKSKSEPRKNQRTMRGESLRVRVAMAQAHYLVALPWS